MKTAQSGFRGYAANPSQKVPPGLPIGVTASILGEADLVCPGWFFGPGLASRRVICDVHVPFSPTLIGA